MYKQFANFGQNLIVKKYSSKKYKVSKNKMRKKNLLYLVKMIRLTHLDAVKQMRHPVERLLGRVLRLPQGPTRVSDEAARQPGGELALLSGHGAVQRLLPPLDIGQGAPKLLQSVIGARETEREQGDN